MEIIRSHELKPYVVMQVPKHPGFETSRSRNVLHPNISCVLCVGSKINVNIILATNHHFFYCHIKANNVINLLTNREKNTAYKCKCFIM